ncbi:hypothetical protein K438DRAFT_1724535 [Mycena galopus ATCC 62051]|nr:hypothetical protein K438DRAFT_1724535 [Mycena galopus ATCC 62051]
MDYQPSLTQTMNPLYKAISVLLFTSVAFNAIIAWRILYNTSIPFDGPLPSEIPLPVKHAALEFNFGQHYHITNDAEWASLLPTHSGRVRLGAANEQFDVGMYSDLACLDTIRRAFLLLRDGARQPFVEAEACLGQIRQAITCNSDLTLEPSVLVCNAKDECAPAASGNHLAHRCRNWAQVREFVEDNQASWGIS